MTWFLPSCHPTTTSCWTPLLWGTCQNKAVMGAAASRAGLCEGEKGGDRGGSAGPGTGQEEGEGESMESTPEVSVGGWRDQGTNSDEGLHFRGFPCPSNSQKTVIPTTVGVQTQIALDSTATALPCPRRLWTVSEWNRLYLLWEDPHITALIALRRHKPLSLAPPPEQSAESGPKMPLGGREGAPCAQGEGVHGDPSTPSAALTVATQRPLGCSEGGGPSLTTSPARAPAVTAPVSPAHALSGNAGLCQAAVTPALTDKPSSSSISKCLADQ